MDGLLPVRPPPLPGTQYTAKLLRYLSTNKARLAQPPHAYVGPSSNQVGNVWQQTYTIATLGLDPNSSLLNPTLTTLFSLGFAGGQGQAPGNKADSSSGQASGSASRQTTSSSISQNVKPLTLRLPADRLLYLLLLFQSSQTRSIASSPNIGPTDLPIPQGAQVLAHASGSSMKGTQGDAKEGDVQSVRSWAGSVRTVGGLFGGGGGNPSTSSARVRQPSSSSWTSFFGTSSSSTKSPAPNAVEETERRARIIWATLSVLPSLTIHPLPPGESLLEELLQEGTYNSLGGLEVKVPLNVFRGLWALELDGYDPRGVHIPVMPGLRSLTVRGVRDGEDWIDELLGLSSEETGLPKSGEVDAALIVGTGDAPECEQENTEVEQVKPRFPTLQYLSLTSAQLFAFPTIPCASLTHLDISSNLLNAIPSTLFSLPHLQSLNLSNNMIESVRGAHLAIPNVTALNLRNNRIDCLSGLERLRALERIDVRKNRLTEIEEVGRLAVLPRLSEIYVGQGNAFRQTEEEEWRARLFLAFAEEGRAPAGASSTEKSAGPAGREWPLVDGYPASWSERRTVQAEIAKRGRSRAPRSEHAQTSSAEDGHGNGLAATGSGAQTPRAPISDPFASTAQGPLSSMTPRDGSIRGVSPTPAMDQARRRRQRIVELDGSNGSRSGSSSNVEPERDSGGKKLSDKGKRSESSALLPETLDSLQDALEPRTPPDLATSLSHGRSRTEHGGETTPGRSRRERVATSTHDHSAHDLMANGTSADDMRAKMEALKEEVGDSWLKVLASQTRVEIARSPGAIRPTQNEGVRDAVPPGVVKVMPKPGKKKRAIGEIK